MHWQYQGLPPEVQEWRWRYGSEQGLPSAVLCYLAAYLVLLCTHQTLGGDVLGQDYSSKSDQILKYLTNFEGNCFQHYKESPECPTI